MQLHLEFYAPGLCLPLAYRQFVQGMIYQALRDDPVYSAAVHDGGEVAQKRRFKLFTFGQLEGKYTVRDRQIQFSGPVSLEIRSIREAFLMRLFRAFRVGNRVRLGNSELLIAGCALEDARISSPTLLVATRSPIVAYVTQSDGKTRFFSPEEEPFAALVVANAQRKWQSVHPEQRAPAFTLRPAENSRFRKQVTSFKSTRITAWDGRFLLTGDPEMLDFLYHTGLGAKNSQGFGMFSPIK